jgi:hypothetical protein
MLGNRHEIPSLQSDFYQQKYRSALKVLFISSIFALLFICCIIYYVLFQVPAVYYATTTEGQIIRLTGISS